MVDVKGGGVP
jgi:hypothetical protein